MMKEKEEKKKKTEKKQNLGEEMIRKQSKENEIKKEK